MGRNARLLVAAVFITNIGNGIHALALATILYEETNSAFAFALVLSGEFVLNIVMMIFAGSWVDRGDPRKMMIAIDLFRGVSLIISTIAYSAGVGLWPLFVALIIINVVKPIYRSAHFALTPSIVPVDEIIHVNAIKGAGTQAGQLIGVALAGVIISFSGGATALMIDGFTFVGSSICILLIFGEIIERVVNEQKGSKALVEDWKAVIRLLKSNYSLFVHLFLASGDFLFVSLLSLCLVPLNESLGGNPINLSALDGAFAIGSLTMSIFVSRLYEKMGNSISAGIGLSMQMIAFVVLAISTSVWVSIITMAVMGVGNSLSVATFMGTLQVRSKGVFKGRIGSIRQMILSIFASITIPIFGGINANYGVGSALLGSAVIVGVYLLVTFILTRQRFFGDRLLTQKSTS